MVTLLPTLVMVMIFATTNCCCCSASCDGRSDEEPTDLSAISPAQQAVIHHQHRHASLNQKQLEELDTTSAALVDPDNKVLLVKSMTNVAETSPFSAVARSSRRKRQDPFYPIIKKVEKVINFGKNVKNLGGKLLGAAGVLSGLFTVFDFIYSKATAPEDPMPLLREMEKKLDSIENGLQDLQRLVMEEHMKTKLFDYERVIRDSLAYSIALNKTSSSTSRSRFLEKGDQLEGAIGAILDGLLGIGAFGSDILTTIRKSKKGGQDHYQNSIDSVNVIRELLQTAIGVLAVYYKTEGADEAHVQHWREEMGKKEDQLANRIRRMDEDLEKWNEDDVVKQMTSIMETYSNETNSQVANRIYRQLNGTYNVQWLVLVYGPAHGWHMHNIESQSMASVFRIGGKNAAVYSFDRNHFALRKESGEALDKVSARFDAFCKRCDVCCQWKCATTAKGGFQMALADVADGAFVNVIDNKYQVQAVSHKKINYKFLYSQIGDYFFFKRRFFFLIIPGKYFRIVSKLNRMVVDDSSRSSTTPGGFVHMHPIHGGANQYWYLDEETETIRTKESLLCLTSHGGYPKQMTLERCEPARRDDQHWRIEGNGTIVNLLNPTRCLDIYHEQKEVGGRLTEWWCHGGLNQKWEITF